MKTALTLTLVALILLIITACGDNSPVFDGDGTVEFQFEINQRTGTVKSPGDLRFDSGFIMIREIVFDGDRQGASSVSITHEHVSTIDFATGIANPPVSVMIPAGQYRSVNLGVEIQDENDEPTIVLEGQYERSDGSIIPVRFEFGSGEVFEAEAERATIASNIPALAKITFDPVSWFDAVRLGQMDNAKTDSSGVIVISETRNSAIFDLVADGLDRNTQAVFR